MVRLHYLQNSFIYLYITMSEKEILERKFTKIDDENFELCETIKSTINVNYKLNLKKLETFKINIKEDIKKIEMNKELTEKNCEFFNEGLNDFKKANEELGFECEISEEITYESLLKEIAIEKELEKTQETL